MLRSRITVLSIALSLSTIGVAGQSQATEGTVALSLPGGNTATGVLHVPSATRPPVVLLVTDGDAAGLATALTTDGIASLRVNGKSADLLAQWISFLRNDERFPLVSVFAEGADLAAGVIAGRAARADGIATRGDTAAASAELARVVATVKTIDASSPADIARQIAAFAKSVPALGRRGNPSPNRTVARRSLRHTVMSAIGGVRVAIEWGQPQMRGREIWGALVPYGEVWMPGADEATVLTTDGPVTIGTIEVPAGDHTFYAQPTADRFELLISRDVGVFHTVRNPALIIGRADMTLNSKSESVEGLTFALQPSADGRAGTLRLSWDTRDYSVTLTPKH